MSSVTNSRQEERACQAPKDSNAVGGKPMTNFVLNDIYSPFRLPRYLLSIVDDAANPKIRRVIVRALYDEWRTHVLGSQPSGDDGYIFFSLFFLYPEEFVSLASKRYLGYTCGNPALVLKEKNLLPRGL